MIAWDIAIKLQAIKEVNMTRYDVYFHTSDIWNNFVKSVLSITFHIGSS